jgi:hypothetical protein
MRESGVESKSCPNWEFFGCVITGRKNMSELVRTARKTEDRRLSFETE